MSKIISTTIVNPNGKEDTGALVQVNGQELYYLLRPIEVIGRYTISFWIKAQANETVVVHYGEQTKSANVTTSWQRVIFSFNAEHIDNVMIQFTTGNYYVYNTQLENGDVATNYNVSPDDMEKQLEEIEAGFEKQYSEVIQTINSFKAEVGETYTTKGETKQVKAELEVKVDKDDNDQIISMINASADEINLKSNRFSLESDNTTIGKNGFFKTVGGEIGGWDITNDGISKETEAYVPPTYEDSEKIRQYILGELELTEAELEFYDTNGDGVVNMLDAYQIRRINRGDYTYDTVENPKPSKVKVEFNPKDGSKILKFLATNPIGEEVETFLGAAGIRTPSLIGSYVNGSDVYGTNIEGKTIKTSSGADLDAVGMKKQSFNFNATISSSATSSLKISDNVKIEGYTLISMVVNVSTTSVLNYTVTPQLFADTELYLKVMNHIGAVSSVSGQVICHYVKNSIYN